jgi:dipeptidyl aminopeptidase/acylaminoacyl peptidase
MKSPWIALTGAAVILALTGADAAAQDIDGVGTFKEALSMESVGGVAISPDGSTVAYTVRRTVWEDNGYDTEIWIARAGGEPYQLTRTAEGSSGSPSWSPDGRWLAFTANRGDRNQVHLISPQGGEAFAVTELSEGVSGYAWSPQGDRLLLRVREPQPDDAKTRQEMYGDFAFDDEQGPSTHLWMMDVDAHGEASEPVRLTEGDYHVGGGEWSPDGASIAYVRQPDPALLSSFETDIYILDVASRESRALVVGSGSDDGPTWSPDGAWILFSEYDRDPESVFYLNGELARIPSSGGDIEVLSRDFDENMNVVAWGAQGVRFVAGARTGRKLYTFNPDTRAVTEMPLPVHVVGSVSFTPDGRAMAFTGQGTDDFTEVYHVASVGRSDAEKLTDMTAQLDGWDVGTREVITWTSEDGAEIEGVLHKPSDYDPAKRYPLLVQIHGGPTGTSRPTVGTNGTYPIVHWLAKGAVVLQPNYRGSAGYGEAFRSLNVRNLGVGDMWDVMSGVQYLIDEGIADPDRMGSMGWSQGGYISAFLTTNTDAFQAISVGAGISNWMTYYVNTDIRRSTR